MPATSQILTGDFQKLSFSILRKVPFLIFWSDKLPRRTNSAHVACSRASTWAAWAEVGQLDRSTYQNSETSFVLLMA